MIDKHLAAAGEKAALKRGATQLHKPNLLELGERKAQLA
jgi:hypothetical protein